MKIGICGNISSEILASQIDQLFPDQQIIIGHFDRYKEELQNPFGDFLNLDICIIALDTLGQIKSEESQE